MSIIHLTTGSSASATHPVMRATAMSSLIGLVAGLVGLYQVNVTMPAGVTPGDAVPIVLTVAGQVSPAASIAVQ